MELGSELLVKLQQYLNDEMDDASRTSFDAEIDQSDELQEFIALYNRIDHLEDDDSWDFHKADPDQLKKVVQLFQNEDTQIFSQKIKQAERTHKEVKPKARSLYKKVFITAAAACLAAIIYWAIPSESSMMNLYSEHNSWVELPSLVVKGDSMDQQKLEVERAFKNQNFESAISLSENIISNTPNIDATMQLYKGIAHLELNQFDQALTTFNHLAQSNSIDNHKAFWYIALVYLKQEDKENAVVALKKVTASNANYKYQEAVDLLEQLTS